MGVLRNMLRVRQLNHAVRGVAGVLLPAGPRRSFRRRLPAVDPFCFELPNGRAIHWDPQGDLMARSLRNDGWDGYDPESTRLFYRLAQTAEIVLDIGAYMGYFALLGAGAGQRNRAFAFEAVPLVQDMCQCILNLNPSFAVELIGAAIGDRTGEVEIYIPNKETELPTTSTNPSYHPGRRGLKVPALRIDDFVARRNLPSVDLVKIDTETTESEVLAGMAETVRRFRPTILLEVLREARVDKLNLFLRENHYKVAWITKQGLRPREAVVADPTHECMNQLFLPVENAWTDP